MSRKRQRQDGGGHDLGSSTRSNYRDTDRSDFHQTIDRDSSTSPFSDTKARKKRITTVDWRAELCRVLEQSRDISDDDILDKLDAAFEELKKSRQRHHAQDSACPGRPRYQVLYRIMCGGTTQEDDAVYEKAPWRVNSGPFGAHLRGASPISNLELYLEQNKDIAFVVYVNFECCSEPLPDPISAPLDHYHPVEADVLPLLESESVEITCTMLRSALQTLADNALQSIPHPEFSSASPEIVFPYLWWFHRREEIDQAISRLDTESQLYLEVFRGYILERQDVEWIEVDTLISEGLVTPEYLRYIYVPGEVVISNQDDNDITQVRGYQVIDWPDETFDRDSHKCYIDVSSWSFDGAFKQTRQRISVTPPESTSAFSIRSLSYYPERFASDKLDQVLLDRGKMFWKCRRRKYVSTPEIGGDGMQSSVENRYMIDIETYKYMHPKEATKATIPDHEVISVLHSDVMSQDEPALDNSFFKSLPTKIIGFNILKKEWASLDVHLLREVQWNNQAFDYLVISDATKVLIKAVVMNQLGGQANSDLIRGKGNGLFMLLHGGPGTGKTLTAESVAEIAKRPLYRVTCGDIGTKAEEVEKVYYQATTFPRIYSLTSIEIVLYLGKTWGCVVLLDEADVFLEQRSLVNLERNALVSVFLRVLEYYDGILILTSNRVGIFDEAFKSRIQLSLRYHKLGQNERYQIWENFLSHLDHFQKSIRSSLTSQAQQIPLIGYGIDVSDLRNNLYDLSQANLNGREIRNALSVARQLALYHKESLKYHHLELVMNEAKKFDDYLHELNANFSAEEISRDRRER